MHAPRAPHQPRVRPHCVKRQSRPIVDAPTTPTAPILAQAEETVLATAEVDGWRYESAEVEYERRTILWGGAIGWLITGTISAIRNHRARREAERLAAPQWRPLGPLVVQATQERLLVWHNEACWSIWYSGITSWHREQCQVILSLAADPPYGLIGDIDGIAGIFDRSWPIVEHPPEVPLDASGSPSPTR